MSETEHHRGKIKEIEFEGDLVEVCEKLLEGDIDPIWDTPYEYFESGYYKKYIVIDDKLYKILESKEYPEDDEIIEASKNEDGTINYELRYYNGGASFAEVLHEALEKIKG